MMRLLMLDRTPSRELREDLWVFQWTIQLNSLAMRVKNYV